MSELPTETTYKSSAADLVGDYTAGGRILNVGVTAGFTFESKNQGASPSTTRGTR